MRLIIVRHAETVENISGIISGHQPGVITENGKVQAQRLAERLKDEKINEIFSSDLHRARFTTEVVAKYHDVPVHYLPIIRERTLGIFENGHIDEFFKARDASGLSRVDFKPEGGENYHELKARTKKFLDKLFDNYENYKDRTVLVSAHGGWNKMLLSILLKKSIEEALEIDQANTCVNIIELRDNLDVKIALINDVNHLES